MFLAPDDATEFLMSGKVIALPTETVYGLAAIATNPSAVARIFEIKKRPQDNPLICHFHSIDQIKKYVTNIPAATEKLINHFSPGPISFMFDLPGDSPLKFATCGSGQLVARIPDHPLFLNIIKKTNLPIAAPSANTSGKVSPTSPAMVLLDLDGRIDGIVDGGRCSVGLESTIVDARNDDEIFILRQGTIGADELQIILPKSKITAAAETGENVIPGTKYRHYAPNTPIILVEKLTEVDKNSALLLTEEAFRNLSHEWIGNLSDANVQIVLLGSIENINDFASKFYEKISSVDLLNVSTAFFLRTEFGNSSLGKALQERIEKITGAS
ncbi:MAG: threonylcarbamoyl-AMP synthase [Chitinophagales bacterium]|nr:threonylcarbamoyl-AMP synthase [Chitinophagales bacterium]